MNRIYFFCLHELRKCRQIIVLFYTDIELLKWHFILKWNPVITFYQTSVYSISSIYSVIVQY